MKRDKKKRALILAAGRGTRMKSESPKVALPVAGKAMILHVIENLLEAGINQIVIVVGYAKEEVMGLVNSTKGADFQFVEQRAQLGTGHAVLSSQGVLASYSGILLVTNGDMPMIRPETFRRLIQTHQSENKVATVLSAKLDEPRGYGRLVRDDQGKLLRIVEEKDADDSIRAIQEVNSGTYVFESPEVFAALKRIGTDNNQKEYYLPDVVALLRAEGKPVGSMIMHDSNEGLGANSMEDLKKLEELMAFGFARQA